MAESTMSNADKKKLNAERQKAVREAWKQEKALVEQGKGTRDWNKSEQKQLKEKGSVQGYEGHHMKSVKNSPEHAGNYNNIQFLSREEHQQAHKGNFKNKTDGMYDPKTGKVKSFNGKDPKRPNAKPLSERYTERSLDAQRSKYADEHGEKSGNIHQNTGKQSQASAKSAYTASQTGSKSAGQSSGGHGQSSGGHGQSGSSSGQGGHGGQGSSGGHGGQGSSGGHGGHGQ